MSNTLTQSDVLALARIVTRANDGAKVTRVIDGDPVIGTARHIVKSADDYNFPSGPHDIRDCVLRVTLDSGMDVTWPVAELVTAMREGEFFPEYP